MTCFKGSNLNEDFGKTHIFYINPFTFQTQIIEVNCKIFKMWVDMPTKPNQNASLPFIEHLIGIPKKNIVSTYHCTPQEHSKYWQC